MGLPSPFPAAAAVAAKTLIEMAPLQITGAQTVVVPIPDNCIAWQVQGVGAGGSGGANANLAADAPKATGGGGGPWARILRNYTSGSSSLTVILGAPGAATASGNVTANNGVDGASSTVSDGTITLTLPGGKKGNATTNSTTCAGSTICASPTVSDGGDIDFSLGGTSGQILGTNNAGTGVSGGAGSGSPYGAGGNSGAVGLDTSDASVIKASGGASCYANSGSVVTGSNSASGGGGKFASANVTSGAGNGGGTLSSTTGIVYGQTSVGQQIIADWFSYEGNGEPGSSSTSALVAIASNGAGSGAGAGSLVTGTHGAGGFKGGSGGIAQTNSPGISTISGAGGAFAGSGGVIYNANNSGNTGKAGFGAGSGAAVNGNGQSLSSGEGGNAAVQIIFYLGKP